MKAFYIFFSFLISVSPLLAGGNSNDYGPDEKKVPITNLESHNLKGSVKTIKYVLTGFGDDSNNNFYEFDKTGNLLEKTSFYSEVSVKSKARFKNGMPIEVTNFKIDGTVTKKELVKYDKKSGKLTEFKQYGDKGSLVLEEKFEFNKKGQKTAYIKNEESPINFTYKLEEDKIIEVAEYKEEGKINRMHIFWYNKKGNKTEWAIYDEKGDNIYKEKYTYDAKGNIESLIKLNGKADTTYSMKARYDSNGNVVLKEEFDENSKLIYKLSAQYKSAKIKSQVKEEFGDGFMHNKVYDDLGNLTKYQKLDSDSEVMEEENFRYKYDYNNNWVRMTKSANDQEEIIVREVSYF